MAANEVKHPLVRHKISLMRKEGISTKDFRELCSEIGTLLTYDATRNLELETQKIRSWSGDEIEVEQLKGRSITVVPILRAGVGMLDGVLKVIPGAKISVVGLYRDEETLQPISYFEKLVPNIDERVALVVDPMLATGGSLIATIDLLKKAGCQRVMGIFLVAAPEGLKKLAESHPDVEVFVASIDEKLNERGYIMPGLGDAGDKIFGTQI